MKKTQIIRPVMVAAAFCLPVAVRGQQDFTNRFTASARLGFNIKAKFGPRLTPDGLAYDHFDGYALTDTGGSASAYTWNWGYDNSAHQISGNNILMSRQPSGGPSLGSYDSDPDYGFEIGYSRPLIVKGKLRFGVEAAGNYMKLDLRDDSGFSGTGTVDSYSFTPGTMPPQSPDPASGQPYQGTVKGPGFLINVPPVSAPAPIAFADHRKFDADVWGFRLGPYLEYPIGEHELTHCFSPCTR